jgi:hypothetical protein
MTMLKKPKIDHESRAGMDKMKITIEGYLPSKKSRDAILKNETKEGFWQGAARATKGIEADRNW